ncbi:MAG: 50S ribosomal protein L10 [Actinomycetia bacterium]|nr:50S ribosomal protein L10 [Actinomycetes bacterium]
MPNPAKYAAVAEIKTDLQTADGVWVVDYRGLTVKESENLRASIRELGASLKVYKNSLTTLALKDLELPDLGNALVGPSAFIFASGDPVAAAKVLKTYAKANPKLQFKGGLLNGQVLDADQVQAIADLPSREELLARLVGAIKNPLSGVVQVLNGPMSALARAIGAIRDQAAA